ncbi:hypothetical protein QQS21_008611 [Conoideocrella luteorostrata]|uniref:Uncharacterized protein n=1 Tax=Conoideocrella luteorostrata TaxID=1105319 RepID=A0AAJ0CKY8_9HYPO|nr:hypothetical protein QQS21_008611 [Conoideocrella luteorostrata]
MAVDCGSSCPVSGGFYRYNPSVGGNALFLAVYALVVPCIIYLGARSRTALFSGLLTIGLASEVLGFVGRVLLHQSLDNPGYFILSLLGTVLGPSLFSASIFVVFPHVLNLYGERLSPFKPMLAELLLYTLIAVAIGVEVVGAVFVPYVFNGVAIKRSASIIAGGLAVQAAALLISAVVYFSLVSAVISGRAVPDDKHSAVFGAPQFKRFLRGVEFSTALLLANSIYRVFEFAGGVDGDLFQNEVAFMVMDGVLPLLSVILLTSFHPGAAFGTAWKQTSPRRAKRPTPLPLREGQVCRLSHSAHHAYDPHIRTQFSPNSPYSQRSAKSSCPPELPSGSPGLPTSPRPTHKPPSPNIPSPRSTIVISKRRSDKYEKRVNQPRDLVNSDALW